jgi:hypothetical protein
VRLKSSPLKASLRPDSHAERKDGAARGEPPWGPLRGLHDGVSPRAGARSGSARADETGLRGALRQNPRPRVRCCVFLLYDSAVSGNCYKVRPLLAQLGLDYERREVDVVERSGRRELLGELNPALRVPTLALDDGRPLAE